MFALGFKVGMDSSLACFLTLMQWIPSFTSSATPADILVTDIAAMSF